MGVPKHPENGISWALYVGDFLLEGVSQWTPCPNGPQSPLISVICDVIEPRVCEAFKNNRSTFDDVILRNVGGVLGDVIPLNLTDRLYIRPIIKYIIKF